jgi:DNA polymerase
MKDNFIQQKIVIFQKLREQVEKCQRCPLYKTTKKIVFGEGPINAKMMVIGEAAGRMESLQGRPFVGPAGKFLDKLLNLGGIDRKNVFITSILKCRPTIDNRNRKPKKEEIGACLPYLKKQIEIINPKYFILLGEVAFLVFFPKEKLKNFRGKWIEKDGKLYFPTYHPAAGLRFPTVRKILGKDFKKLTKILKVCKETIGG